MKSTFYIFSCFFYTCMSRLPPSLMSYLITELHYLTNVMGYRTFSFFNIKLWYLPFYQNWDMNLFVVSISDNRITSLKT